MHPLHIVDVFAERRYSGNQLAVVLEQEALSGAQRQSIAQEMNFSETTFVTTRPEAGGAYRVAIFTPAEELPFAGHPTLGTAWVIREHVAKDRPRQVRLHLGVGEVPVAFETGPAGNELAWLTAPRIDLGPTCEPQRVLPSLGLTPGDLDPKGPVQQLSVGFSVLIVPVRSLAALTRIRPDPEAFARLRSEGLSPYLYVFCGQAHHSGNDLCARFFFEAQGVREDPATGSATACLGAYLLRHRYYGKADLSLRIEQGYEINRPSLLMLRATESGGASTIQVGGRVIPVAQGRLV